MEALRPWLIGNSHAMLRVGALSGQVDVSCPQLGLNRLAIQSTQVGGWILGVRSGRGMSSAPLPVSLEQAEQPTWPLADAYVRGSDLVATYQAREDWPYATQIYWSAAESGGVQERRSCLSLLVSLQTSLLDTWPTMFIASRLVADEVLLVTCESGELAEIKSLGRGNHRVRPVTSTCCVLSRLAGLPFSYAEIMPASDMREVVIDRGDDACHVCWELFAEFLEKGVIRRARMQSMVVPRASDVEHAAAACREVEQRPLPLTS
jgi:hypothetical protein